SYMVQNQGTDAMAGLNPHIQRSHLPGASAAGAACAKAADLFIGVSDLGVAIDVWMAGMYHRRPMLDPQLERIGVGYARPSRWDADGCVEVRKRHAQGRYLARRVSCGQASRCSTGVRRRVTQSDPQPWHRGLSDHAAVSTVR